MAGLARRRVTPLAVVVALVVVALVAEATFRFLAPALPARDHSQVFAKRDQYDALVDRGAPIDVIATGASQSDAGFDPDLFDEVSPRFDGAYNASIRGLPVDADATWVNRTLAPAHRPRLVILVIHPIQLGLPATDSARKIALAEGSILSAVRRTEVRPWSGAERWIEDRSAFLQHRSDLFRPMRLFRAVGDRFEGRTSASFDEERAPDFWKNNLTERGQNLQYRAIPDEVRDDPVMAGRVRDLIAHGLDLDQVDQAVRGLQTDDTDVVVVVAPIDTETLVASGLDPDLLARSVARVAARAEAAGAPTLDLSDAGYTPDLFHDKLHLDLPGSQRFTTEIARWVDGLCADGTLHRCRSAGS